MSEELAKLLRRFGTREMPLADLLRKISDEQWTEKDLTNATKGTKDDLLGLLARKRFADDDEAARFLHISKKTLQRWLEDASTGQIMPKYFWKLYEIGEQDEQAIGQAVKGIRQGMRPTLSRALLNRVSVVEDNSTASGNVVEKREERRMMLINGHETSVIEQALCGTTRNGIKGFDFAAIVIDSGHTYLSTELQNSEHRHTLIEITEDPAFRDALRAMAAFQLSYKKVEDKPAGDFRRTVQMFRKWVLTIFLVAQMNDVDDDPMYEALIGVSLDEPHFRYPQTARGLNRIVHEINPALAKSEGLKVDDLRR
jgi:hypothetical protein